MSKRVRIIPNHRDKIDLDRLASTLLAIVGDHDDVALAELTRRGRELVAETLNAARGRGRGMTVPELAALFLLATCAAVILIALLMHAQPDEMAVVSFELRFPRDLEAKATQRFLASISALLPPWWRRWFDRPFVVLEVVGTDQGIRHVLRVSEHWRSMIEQQLRASLPGLRYEVVETQTLQATKATEYRCNNRNRQLGGDISDLSAKLLASFDQLSSSENIALQWVLAPAPRQRVARASSSDAHGRGIASLLLPSADVLPTAEEARAANQKRLSPHLLAAARMGVRAASPSRAAHLLRRAEVAMHAASAPGVHLQRRLLPSRIVARRFARQSLPIGEWIHLNVVEISGLIGWPIGVEHIPGLILSGYRQVPPTRSVPRTGTVIADSTYPGADRPIALDLEARLRHVHVIGPTGVGKTTLLANMIASDIDAGYGVLVIDPKTDLVADVLARIPDHRQDDVVVLDPADTTRPVGLNPLQVSDGISGEVVVENLVGILHGLNRSSWGPRTSDILRAVLLALVGSGDATLCDVPLVLTEPVFRRRLVGKLDDPAGLEPFFSWYEALSDAERMNVIGPVLNKVRSFTMRPTVRGIIGQAKPSVTLRRVLAERKILLVPLGGGVLGEEAAALLGTLVIAELWQATTARAALPREQRSPVMAHLDEFQNFVHGHTPMASVLAEARGYGLGLVLAHQHLGQTPPEVRDAVLANARSRVTFQLQASDARILSREVGSALDAGDLQGLGAFEVMVQAFAGGSTQPPASGRTRPLAPAMSDGDALRERSRERFGVDRASVERAILARQQRGSAHTDAVRRRWTRPENDS